jgi:hypothetical protein
MQKKVFIGLGAVLVIGLGFLGYKMYNKNKEGNTENK